MNGYEFFIVEKSTSLKILLAGESAADEKSLLFLFSPGQAGKVYEFISANGGVCFCNDETSRVAIITRPFDPVAFVVRFKNTDADSVGDSLSSCEDAVVRRLLSAFERADRIAEAFALFPDDALIEANMLLSEFLKTRTAYSNRKAAFFGFAVVNVERLVRLLISYIIFLSFLLDGKAGLELEISNCGGIFCATLSFAAEYLEGLILAFPRVCGDENVVIRSCEGGYTIEAIAAVEDNSKIGLKSDID